MPRPKKKKEFLKQRVNLTLDGPVYRWAKDHAKQIGMSVSGLVDMVVGLHLANLPRPKRSFNFKNRNARP